MDFQGPTHSPFSTKGFDSNTTHHCSYKPIRVSSPGAYRIFFFCFLSYIQGWLDQTQPYFPTRQLWSELCHSKTHEALTPLCDDSWGWGLWVVIQFRWGHEGWVLLMALVSLSEETPRAGFPFLPLSLHLYVLRKGYMRTEKGGGHL